MSVKSRHRISENKIYYKHDIFTKHAKERLFERDGIKSRNRQLTEFKMILDRGFDFTDFVDCEFKKYLINRAHGTSYKIAKVYGDKVYIIHKAKNILITMFPVPEEFLDWRYFLINYENKIKIPKSVYKHFLNRKDLYKRKIYPIINRTLGYIDKLELTLLELRELYFIIEEDIYLFKEYHRINIYLNLLYKYVENCIVLLEWDLKQYYENDYLIGSSKRKKLKESILAIHKKINEEIKR